MRTYLAFDLKRKKFYVGSTLRGYRRRQWEHYKEVGDHFHNALNSRPEDFYWVCGDDDGLETRDEEQFYLDFYYGTMWCYNKTGKAAGGTATHTEEQKRKWSEERRGSGNPRHGVEVTAETRQKISEANRGRRRTEEQKRRTSESGMGKVWWTDGEKETKAFECPGLGWKRGRKPRG